MTSIKLVVTGARARAEVNGVLTSGMVGIPVTIEYDDTWKGLTKNLVCRCSHEFGRRKDSVRTIANIGTSAMVAHEVMQADMHLYLGIEGYSPDGRLIVPTTWAKCGLICPGAHTNADQSADPTLPVWAQLENEVTLLKQNTVSDNQIVAVIEKYLKENPIDVPDSSQSIGIIDVAKQSAFYGGIANFMGDSITHVNTERAKKNYVEWVKEILGLETANNYGVSGTSYAANSANAEQAFYVRYTEMADDADLIVVFGGVNDCWHDSTLGSEADTDGTTVYGALNVLCAGLITKYPGKTIVFVTPTKQNIGSFTLKTEEVAHAVKTVCAKYGIPVFDANAESGIYPKDNANASRYTTDKLHLNDAGHERLGKMLGNYILQKYGYTLAVNQYEAGEVFTITADLESATLGNTITTVFNGASYNTTVTPYDGYVISGVTVTMDGVDVTNEVYSGGYINIPAVTGNVVITVNTIAGDSKHYFSEYSWTNGGLYENDAMVTSYGTGYSYSENIAIDPSYGSIILCTTCKIPGCFYASDGTFIANLTRATATMAEYTVEIPSNAAYMIINKQDALDSQNPYWMYGEDTGGETEVTLTSISATYSGGDVTAGTAVADLTGIVVTAHYSDSTTATVTDYTLSGTIAEGENTVTVSYDGKITTFTVTGVAEDTGGDDTGGEDTTYSKHYFSEYSWTNGGYYTNNAITSSAQYSYSENIAIDPSYGSIILCTTCKIAGCFYASDGTFISNITQATATMTEYTVETPSDAAYMILNKQDEFDSKNPYWMYAQ